jgi:hypothetical protein
MGGRWGGRVGVSEILKASVEPDAQLPDRPMRVGAVSSFRSNGVGTSGNSRTIVCGRAPARRSSAQVGHVVWHTLPVVVESAERSVIVTPKHTTDLWQGQLVDSKRIRPRAQPRQIWVTRWLVQCFVECINQRESNTVSAGERCDSSAIAASSPAFSEESLTRMSVFGTSRGMRAA